MINCCRFEHFSGFPETAAQFCLSGLSFTSATVPQGVGQSQIHFAFANGECRMLFLRGIFGVRAFLLWSTISLI